MPVPWTRTSAQSIAALQKAQTMWRANSLFGQSELPNHHAAILTETHASLAERVQVIGEHVGHTLWGEPVMLCHVCHAELQAHEFAGGCCADTDSCAWRSLSERCCW